MKVCARHNRWIEIANTPQGKVSRRCPECPRYKRKRAVRVANRPPRNYEA